jgi:hypothetical protein
MDHVGRPYFSNFFDTHPTQLFQKKIFVAGELLRVQKVVILWDKIHTRNQFPTKHMMVSHPHVSPGKPFQ